MTDEQTLERRFSIVLMTFSVAWNRNLKNGCCRDTWRLSLLKIDVAFCRWCCFHCRCLKLLLFVCIKRYRNSWRWRFFKSLSLLCRHSMVYYFLKLKKSKIQLIKFHTKFVSFILSKYLLFPSEVAVQQSKYCFGAYVSTRLWNMTILENMQST